MRESLIRPITCALFNSSKSLTNPPTPCFAIQKEVRRLFCSAGASLHQFSQVKESLQAFVTEMPRHVEEDNKRSEEVEWIVRCYQCDCRPSTELWETFKFVFGESAARAVHNDPTGGGLVRCAGSVVN